MKVNEYLNIMVASFPGSPQNGAGRALEQG